MKKNFKKYIAGLISAIMLIGIMPVMNVSADYMNTSAMTELFTLNMNKTENSIIQNYVESVGRGATGTLKDSLVVKTTSSVTRVNRSETDKALAMSTTGTLLSLEIPEQKKADKEDKTIISFDFNADRVGTGDALLGIGGDFWFEKDDAVVKKTVGNASYRNFFAGIFDYRITANLFNVSPTELSENIQAKKWYNFKLVLGYDSYSIYLDNKLIKSGSNMSYCTITGDTKEDGYKFLGIADKVIIRNHSGSNSIDNISVYTGKLIAPALTMDFTGYTGGKNVALGTAQFNSTTNENVMTPATGVGGKAATDISQKIEWSTTPQTTVLQLVATSSAKDMYICGKNGSSILSFSFMTDGKVYPTITARGVETEAFTHTDGKTYTNGVCDDSLVWVRNKNNNTSIYVLGETHSVPEIAPNVWHTIVLVANYDNTYSLYYDGSAVVENHTMKNLKIRVDGDSSKTQYPAQFRGITSLSIRSGLNEVSSGATSGCMYYDDISLTATKEKYTVDLTKDVYSVAEEVVEDDTLKSVTIAKDGFVSPTAMLYAASYEANGRMSDVKTSQILSNMLPGEAEFAFNLEIPDGGTSKVFVWDEKTQKPLMKAGGTSDSAETVERGKKVFVVAASIFQSYNHYDSEKKAGGYGFRYPRTGVGQVLNKFFDEGITVSNKAMSGQSSKAFYNTYWSRIKEDIQPGDYVLVQLGHNDWWKTGRDEMNQSFSTNPTLPSDNEYYETHDNINAEGSTAFYTTSHYSYKWYLRQYVEQARALGATPVLIAGTDRMSISGGAVAEDTVYAPYRDAVYELGEELNVPVLDVNTRWRNFLSSLENVEMVKNYYLIVAKDDVRYANDPNFDETDFYNVVDENTWIIDRSGAGTWSDTVNIADENWDGILLYDTTHFNEYATELIAEMIAEEIKANPELADLAQYLNGYDPECPWPELQFK